MKTKMCVILIGMLGMVFCGTTGEGKQEKDSPPADKKTEQSQAEVPQGISLLGNPLYAGKPSEGQLAKYREARGEYLKNPDVAENIIWLGRRIAYMGEYKKAIEIFTEGIKKFPDDPRFYRHRGHRYISIRKFDEAISDFTRAVELTRGKKDQIEPDGMPNARNIPVSTLQGNIWYHLLRNI